jgi:hypothetical protein
MRSRPAEGFAAKRRVKSHNFHKVARHFFDSARISLQTMSYGKLMAVMVPREKWSDERLDMLNEKVDDGFERLDGDIKSLRQDMNTRFNAVDARFDSVDARFNALDGRFNALDAKFDNLRQDLFKAAVAVIVAMIGATGAIVAALLGTSVL